jgi:purine-binding chemotaxis protein CheW
MAGLSPPAFLPRLLRVRCRTDADEAPCLIERKKEIMHRNEINTELHETLSQNSDQAGKYLTFELNNTEFGIEILKVVELLTMMEITTVPMWPDFAKGTINLRGQVIPVIDLRQKFGLSPTELTDKTCTIVMELGEDNIGIEVEAVNEVRELNAENISAPPNIGGTVDSEFILGMGKADGKTIILLNLEKVLVGLDVQKMKEHIGKVVQPA